MRKKGNLFVCVCVSLRDQVFLYFIQWVFSIVSSMYYYRVTYRRRSITLTLLHVLVYVKIIFNFRYDGVGKDTYVVSRRSGIGEVKIRLEVRKFRGTGLTSDLTGWKG